MRMAVLEDDPVQPAFVTDTLSAAGHTCHGFSKGQALVHALRRETFDLLVLDWGIPDMTGEAVLQWVKQSGTRAPSPRIAPQTSTPEPLRTFPNRFGTAEPVRRAFIFDASRA